MTREPLSVFVTILVTLALVLPFIATAQQRTKMPRIGVLWGGETGHPGGFATPPHGLAYDPRADRWLPLPQAPLRGRLNPVAAWTGKSLIIWGGDPGFTDGAVFTPSG